MNAIVGTNLGAPSRGAIVSDRYAEGKTAVGGRLRFIGIWLFSILDSSARAREDRAGYLAQRVRAETGIGAAAASSH